MLTPLDIENKKFNKKAFGYNQYEVEEFLTEVIENYEYLYKENMELKDKIEKLSTTVQNYKNIEETLQSALIVAQQTGEEIKKNAYEKRDNIINQAEIRASQIIEGANKEVLKENQKLDSLKKDYKLFKSRVEALFKAQLKMLNDVGENKSAT